MSKEILPYNTTVLSLKEVEHLNVNDRKAKKRLIKEIMRRLNRNERMKNLLLKFATFGFRSWKVRAIATQILLNTLAMRKLYYAPKLLSDIESLRDQLEYTDPRQGINSIFFALRTSRPNEDIECEYRHVYTPTELLLFITNPPKDVRPIKRSRYKAKGIEYSKTWSDLRKGMKKKQFYLIDQINQYNELLKEEYRLNGEAIRDRLNRTTLAKKWRGNLTNLKHLASGFQEIVLAYQDFEELKETNNPFYETLNFIQHLDEKEVLLLLNFIHKDKTPNDLPIEIRRKLVQLTNRQKIIQTIQEQNLGHLCELVLNSFQWNFFLASQKISQSTLELMDWAYEQVSQYISPVDAFAEMLPSFEPVNWEEMEESEKHFFESHEASKELDGFFLSEIGHEWPSILIKERNKEYLFQEKINHVTVQQLKEIFDALVLLTQSEHSLLHLLQAILSIPGRTALQNAYEKVLFDLIGERSDFFFPLFSLEHLCLHKVSDIQWEITFYVKPQILDKEMKSVTPHDHENSMIQLLLEKPDQEWYFSQPGK